MDSQSVSRIRRRLSGLFKSFYRILTGDVSFSYAQFGEDVVLRGFLRDRFERPDYRGFWVDIGAHHPMRMSNTKLFYDRGWRGINVDALPAAIVEFDRCRKRDINVNVGIGEVDGALSYYQYEDHAVNTFSKEFAEKNERDGRRCIAIEKVPVITLEHLLDKYLPEGQHIDFFSIDTEGLDIEILKSNDWTRYRPDYVFIEIHAEGTIASISSGEVADFLKEKGYAYVGQCFCTSLFERVG